MGRAACGPGRAWKLNNLNRGGGRLRGLRAGLPAKLYLKFADKTSNYEKAIYARSV